MVNSSDGYSGNRNNSYGGCKIVLLLGKGKSCG